MKNILISIFAALALTAGAAAADDFDNTTASVTAEFEQFTLTVESDSDNGYTKLQFGATIFEYELSETVDAKIDAFTAHYDAEDQYGVGGAYTLTYSVDALSIWGVAEVEYIGLADDFNIGELYVTPTVGVGYDLTPTVTAWGEVGYTWIATNDWDHDGGTVEVGVDFELADNVVFRTSLSRDFDTAVEETQVNLGLNFNF
jgi:hypothetical protein